MRRSSFFQLNRSCPSQYSHRSSKHCAVFVVVSRVDVWCLKKSDKVVATFRSKSSFSCGAQCSGLTGINKVPICRTDYGATVDFCWDNSLSISYINSFSI